MARTPRKGLAGCRLAYLVLSFLVTTSFAQSDQDAIIVCIDNCDRSDILCLVDCKSLLLSSDNVDSISLCASECDLGGGSEDGFGYYQNCVESCVEDSYYRTPKPPIVTELSFLEMRSDGDDDDEDHHSEDSESSSTSTSGGSTATQSGASGQSESSNVSSDDNIGLSPGALAGIIVGAVAAVALLAVGAWLLYRRRRRDAAATTMSITDPDDGWIPGTEIDGVGKAELADTPVKYELMAAQNPKTADTPEVAAELHGDSAVPKLVPWPMTSHVVSTGMVADHGTGRPEHLSSESSSPTAGAAESESPTSATATANVDDRTGPEAGETSEADIATLIRRHSQLETARQRMLEIQRIEGEQAELAERIRVMREASNGPSDPRDSK